MSTETTPRHLDRSTGPITHLGPDGTVPPELHDLLTPATLSLAGANIIMQLAQSAGRPRRR